MGETWAIPRPLPGSDDAVAAGCRCPVMDNAHGAGIPGTADVLGGPHFWITAECPIHAMPTPDAMGRANA